MAFQLLFLKKTTAQVLAQLGNGRMGCFSPSQICSPMGSETILPSFKQRSFIHHHPLSFDIGRVDPHFHVLCSQRLNLNLGRFPALPQLPCPI
ncbi:hypothetical protein Moror_2108 [Moniliophthora roreri MCA 2997]|uniref:Uncharacterized protein n=1 Tax=Moniliophthora roreri (strain MCA 2997) TaxID=1381753 RepID=V2WAA1_MONRO|nr:hypothetical protein Moror_2108 [Moniliophthora roreri MCA 2997]